jgi:hypothetical protein
MISLLPFLLFLRFWVFAKLAARSLRPASNNSARNHETLDRRGWRSLDSDAFCMFRRFPKAFPRQQSSGIENKSQFRGNVNKGRE